MSNPRAVEVLQSIVEECQPSAVTENSRGVDQVNEVGNEQELAFALHKELGVAVTANEIKSVGSLLKLSELIESRLPRDPIGRSLVDIYAAVEQFVREELPHDINYHWHAAWRGDLLHKTDSLEDVELVIRMEEAFGFSIPDRDAQEMHTVAQTVRYLWRRSCEQSFRIRERPTDVCKGAFIFHELRRFLMIRGAVSRRSVRLSTRLGDLLPSWNFRSYRQVGSMFGVDLPHGNLLTRSLGLKRRTTIRELVTLIANGADDMHQGSPSQYMSR